MDTVLEEIPALQGFVFAVEYVPGQYDQRADSAEQCISMLTLIMVTSFDVLVYCYREALSQRTRKCHQSILY